MAISGNIPSTPTSDVDDTFTSRWPYGWLGWADWGLFIEIVPPKRKWEDGEEK